MNILFDEIIVVSFTTWKKRIHLAKNVFNTMLSQTKMPDKIILNLSIDEFPKKENELPFELIKLINDNDICEINWVKENTKVWKKFMPILDKYPNDIIIPIDDDIDYPKNYIEIMYNEYIKRNGEQPIVCYPNKRDNNLYGHSGPFSLVKKSFFGKYLNEIYNGLISKKSNIHWQSDEVYSYCIWLNKKRYYYTNKIDGIKLYDSSKQNKIDAYSNYGAGWNDLMKTIKQELFNFIKEKYNITNDNILNGNINVNFTTWKMREWSVPKMLESLKNQTLKADKIILWLSKEEYNGIIPQSIKDCYDKGLITDVEWVEKNIYGHKRWESIKKYNDCYNIYVDDDILYDKNYIKDLYTTALKNQGCEIVWSSQMEDYVGTKRVSNSSADNGSIKSNKLQTLSGMACFPPYTYPIEAFKYSELRDKWCPRCDDSWNRAWIIKDGIDIIRIYNRNRKVWRDIPGAMKDGVWRTENSKIVNGIEGMTRNFANALYCANAINEAKKIWPKFDVRKCATFDESIKIDNNIEYKKEEKIESDKAKKEETIKVEEKALVQKDNKVTTVNKEAIIPLNENKNANIVIQQNNNINYANSISERLKEKIDNKKRKRQEELNKLNHGIDLTYFF